MGKKEVGGEGQGPRTPASSPEPPPPSPYREFEGRAAVTPGPLLKSRFKDPIRVILDSNLRIPLSARLLHLNSPAPTWIATTRAAPADKILALQELGAEVFLLPQEDGRVALEPLLRLLGERRVQSVLVEGGAETLGSFFDQGLVDKFHFFYAPLILGGKDAPGILSGRGVARLAQAHRARDLTIRRLQGDLLLSGYLR